jgi:hypothetical protein
VCQYLEDVPVSCHITCMAKPKLQSTLTCPKCGHQATEAMPMDACVFFYDCKGCEERLKPLPGSCCVFCSYGSVPCPPIQEGVEPCCAPKSDESSKDWVGSVRTSLLAWWLPHGLVLIGLFATIPARAAIWVAALAWMGVACLLNARLSGRTHCRFTGPYYLAMIVPTLTLGVVEAPLYAWLILAALMLLGDKIIWWGSERYWGAYSLPSSPHAQRSSRATTRPSTG